MKKSITILMLLAFAFSFETIKAQDMSEQQRLERCQNNKNRIAELESQLSVINADLSASMTKNEIEDARDKMVYVRGFKKSVSRAFGNLNTLDRIGAQYNFSPNDCLGKNITIDEMGNRADVVFDSCLMELEKIIAKKIDKAMSLNRPTLLAKKNEIDKQIASHQNNLIALGCIKPPVSKSENYNNADDSKLSGIWESDNSGLNGIPTLQLNVSGGIVSGGSTYRSASSKITGGSYDPKSKILSFSFLYSDKLWDKNTCKATFTFYEENPHYWILEGRLVSERYGSQYWKLSKEK